MNIFLTGGSGFVGRSLYEELKDAYRIFAPSSKELDLLNYQKVEKYIKKNKINVVIHSAVRGGDDVLDTTLRMFASLLRNINTVDRIIHFGSGAEYAKTRDIVKVRESDWGEYIPQDGYGLAKYIIHKIIQNEKKIVNLRLFGVYGKYESYKFKFISNAIVKNLLRLPIIIKQDVIFDYLYISDLVPIVKYFIEHKSNSDAFNIAPNKSIKLSEIVKLINEISSHPSNIIIKNKKYNFQYTGNNKKLKRTIPNIKFTSYKDGIKELYRYYSNIISTIDKKAVMQDEYFKKSKIRS